jgi:ABC-type nitrate/sulfonate/bicarbonate transport system permease component
MALAIVIGALVGILIGVSGSAARSLGPLLEFMRAIPPPATVPVAALLIGYNETMKLTVVTLSALWPILLNTTAAARGIDPLLIDVARSFRLSALDRVRRVVAPAIVPALMLGIRIALPLALVVALLVEMLTSLPGIGALMIRSQRNFQSAEVYAMLVLVGLFGFVVNDVFAVIETLVLRRWPPRAALTS